jgi:chromosome segregation ATPase
MSEKYEVDKKSYLKMEMSNLEKEVAGADKKVERLKSKKDEIDNEIKAIKANKAIAKAAIKKIREDNRDLFPVRGRKAATDIVAE